MPFKRKATGISVEGCSPLPSEGPALASTVKICYSDNTLQNEENDSYLCSRPLVNHPQQANAVSRVSSLLSSVQKPGSPTNGSRRSNRTRRAPRKFTVDDGDTDTVLKKVLERSRLETRRVSMNYTLLPMIPEVKMLSMDDFLINPISFFERMEHYGREYGAVKIVPPDDWKIPFSLQDLLNDEVEFHVRVQDIHTLMQGRKFRHPQVPLRASELKALDTELKNRFFNTQTPPLAAVEALYWKSVETSEPEITVRYAADLTTNTLGSGFPTEKSQASTGGARSSMCVPAATADASKPIGDAASAGKKNGSMTGDCSQNVSYATHPWNLTRFARGKGSLLSSYHRDVAGVTSPWLYVGVIFSTFCWHAEDNYFAACNYHHWGPSKVWYVIPSSRAASVERLLQQYMNTKDADYVLHSLTVQLPPSFFIQQKIPIYRAEQKENEFLMLWPRTYHAGFNAGFNCNEACNFAPASWLPWGFRSIKSYRYMRSTCIPFHQLLLRAACNAEDLEAPQLLQVCHALMRVLHEEFGNRQAAKEKCLSAFLMHLDAAQISQLSSLPTDAPGIAGELVRTRSCFAALVDHSLTPSSTRKKTFFGYAPTEKNRSQLTEVSSGTDAARKMFIEFVARVVSLPVKDCDNCGSCCTISCVTCPHVVEHSCLDCLGTEKCKCKQQLVLLRFPLPTLRLLIDCVRDLLLMKSKAEALVNERETHLSKDELAGRTNQASEANMSETAAADVNTCKDICLTVRKCTTEKALNTTSAIEEDADAWYFSQSLVGAASSQRCTFTLQPQIDEVKKTITRHLPQEPETPELARNDQSAACPIIPNAVTNSDVTGDTVFIPIEAESCCTCIPLKLGAKTGQRGESASQGDCTSFSVPLICGNDGAQKNIERSSRRRLHTSEQRLRSKQKKRNVKREKNSSDCLLGHNSACGGRVSRERALLKDPIYLSLPTVEQLVEFEQTAQVTERFTHEFVKQQNIDWWLKTQNKYAEATLVDTCNKKRYCKIHHIVEGPSGCPRIRGSHICVNTPNMENVEKVEHCTGCKELPDGNADFVEKGGSLFAQGNGWSLGGEVDLTPLTTEETVPLKFAESEYPSRESGWHRVSEISNSTTEMFVNDEGCFSTGDVRANKLKRLATRQDVTERLVRQLTWRYFLSALRDEEENGENVLPMFEKVTKK